MRIPKEIAVLLVLLAGVMIFVLWYVADRKAKTRADENAPRPAAVTAPASSTQSAITMPSPEPVALGGDNEKKTIDFSSGQPVVKDDAENKAAMDSALADMAAATEGVSFGPSKKQVAPASASPAPAAAPSQPKP